MKLSTRSLWFNASVAFALAGMTALTTHELSHLVAGKLLGEQATLYANAVEYAGTVSKTHQIITAATGPLFSLVSGLVVMVVARRWGKGFWRLFWMWLGLMSAQIAFGYFIIAPFAQNGDTGKVFDLLDVPSFVYYLSAAVGVLGELWLARQFAKQVLRYTDNTVRTMRPFGIYAWLTGTAVMLLVYIFAVRNLSDADQVVCLAGVFAAGIFAPMFSFFYRKLRAEPESLSLKTPVTGLVLTIVFAGLVMTVLASGIKI